VDLVRRSWREVEAAHVDSAHALAARAQDLIRGGRDEEATCLLTDYMARNVERVLARARDLLAALSEDGPARQRSDPDSQPATALAGAPF
jgi:hypothetical protein